MTTAKWWIRGGILLGISAGLFLLWKPVRSTALGGSGLSEPSGTTNPVPLINQPLVPSAVAPGEAGFTLTVNGTGFVSGSVVNWNGSPRATTFVSKSQLTASILASDIVTATTARVTVTNPPRGGGVSNTQYFPVTPPASTALFTATTVNSVPLGGPMIATDLNGDGILDLVAYTFGLSGNVNVSLGNGDGTFRATASLSPCPIIWSVATGDFNGDGKPDLVAGCDAQGTGTVGVAVMLGNGDGTFQSAITFQTATGPDFVAVGDFNGDGKLDLAVSTEMANTISIYLGNGDGTFTLHSEPPAGTSPTMLAVGDFNGDGKLDLVTLNSLNGSSYTVLLGQGGGFFSNAGTFSAGFVNNSIIVADFNGDGKLDLAISGDGTDILLGNGDGTFQNQESTYGGGGPAVVGDFNGDGKIDLANSFSSQSEVFVFLGNGNGTFQSALTLNVFEGLGAAGDFNGDGRTDLATSGGFGSNGGVLLEGGLQLSSISLNFGRIAVGTVSAPQSVTVTNLAGVAAAVAFAFSGSDAVDFAQTNNCGTSLPAGGSCTVNVTFDPMASGNLSASLVISGNPPSSSQSVSLSGFGTNPAVTLSPKRLRFGDQKVGTTSRPQSITLMNTGNGGLTINGIKASGDFIESNDCAAHLAQQAHCTINVKFMPTQVGTRLGLITITDDAANSPQTVPLMGSGTSGSQPTDQPAVMLVPSSLNFPTELVQQKSLAQKVTLTNTGNATLNLTSVALTGSDPTDFHEGTTCGHTLGAGASCTFSLYFQPTKKGNRTASLTLTDDAPGSPQSVPLSGAGTFVSVAPPSPSFGNQTVGTMSNPQTITVTNISANATVSISSISISGGTSSAFSQTNNCPGSLAPKGSCSLSVVFQPTSRGAKSATLSVFDNGGGSPQKVALTGAGT